MRKLLLLLVVPVLYVSVLSLSGCGHPLIRTVAATPDYVITQESDTTFFILARSQNAAQRLAQTKLDCAKRPCMMRLVGTIIVVDVPKAAQ